MPCPVFFINVKDKFLDKNEESPGYAVFGKVNGAAPDVVDKIIVKTGLERVYGEERPGTPPSRTPEEDIIIKSVRVEKPK